MSDTHNTYPASVSARALDYLLILLSPLLGGKIQPTIHEHDSDDKSILSNITDAELDESGLNSST